MTYRNSLCGGNNFSIVRIDITSTGENLSMSPLRILYALQEELLNSFILVYFKRIFLILEVSFLPIRSVYNCWRISGKTHL